MRTANTTELTIDQDKTGTDLTFKQQVVGVGRMSLKGLKPGEDSKLRDEPFMNDGKQAPAQAQGAASNSQGQNAAAEETKGTPQKEEKKDPILGLDSNNNNNQNKVPLKTID